MTYNALLRTIMMGCGMTKPVEHWLRLAYEADSIGGKRCARARCPALTALIPDHIIRRACACMLSRGARRAPVKDRKDATSR